MALRAETAGVRVYNAHIERGKNDAFRRKQLSHLTGEEGRDILKFTLAAQLSAELGRAVRVDEVSRLTP